MPVIVVGADTPLGSTVVGALLNDGAEVRAFVSDAEAAESLKRLGAKVALGDVSDATHLAGAAYRTFCAVLLSDAAHDGRERSFASTPAAVAEAWADGLASAGTRRAIWVGADTDAGEHIRNATPEFASIDPKKLSAEEVIREVARLESADRVTET